MPEEFTRQSLAAQLKMLAADGLTVTAKFDGVDGNEIIDRKLNPRFSPKAVDQAQRQAATAAYNGLLALWKLSIQDAVDAVNRFMRYANIGTITVRLAP